MIALLVPHISKTYTTAQIRYLVSYLHRQHLGWPDYLPVNHLVKHPELKKKKYTEILLI